MLNSVYLTSLGCNKNLVDSEVVLGKIVPKMNLVSDPAIAEVIIVNTCAFIGDAQQESIEAILELIDYKQPELGSCKCFVVMGCMTQRYVNELKKELPEVDIFVGTGEYQNIDKYLIEFYEKNRPLSYVKNPEYIHTADDKRISATPPFSRYLKVSEGCDRCCTFCIIPKIRGKLRSRTVASLVTETKRLVVEGSKEINIISQDLSSYGKDLPKSDNLYTLLDSLCKINGVDWLRLFYYYPDDLSDEVIDLIKSSKNICKYIDIPIQHFATNILKRMGRKITGEEIVDKITRLREKIPGIVLRTSLIVGFPGESEEDFQKLIRGVSEIKFDHLGVFKFSPEDGTPAAKLKNKIPQEIIDDRYSQVYELQKEISEELLQGYVGQTVEVYIEGLHPDTDLLIVGRHQGQAPDIDGKVIINEIGPKISVKLEQGTKVLVKITEALDYDLVGVAESVIN